VRENPPQENPPRKTEPRPEGSAKRAARNAKRTRSWRALRFAQHYHERET